MLDTKKKLMYVLFLSQLTLPSWALTSLTHTCPERFVGTVLSVSELQAPLLNQKKIEVVFQVDEVEKGNVGNVVTLRFIPISHVNITSGAQYSVTTENGFLCDIDKH